MKNRFWAASCAALGLALVGHVSPAAAQAWVPEKGVLGAGVTYQFDSDDTLVQKFQGQSFDFDGNDTLVQTILLDASYTPIEHLGLRLLFPMMFTRFSGVGNPLLPHGEWDDQKTHFTLQDLRLDARYQLLDSPLAVTPLIGVSVPMSDYPIQGFAAPGRGVKQLHLGLSVARTLEPILPNLYFNLAYEFSLAQKVDDQPDLEQYSQNHSLLDFQTGYFITDKIAASLGLTYVLYHGGVNLAEYYNLTGPVRDYHDAVLKEEILLLGASVGYAISDTLSASIYGRYFLTGNNTRATRQLGLNLSWQLPVATEPVEVEYVEDGDDVAANAD